MRVFDKNGYSGEEMVRCKALIKYAKLDSQREKWNQKLRLPEISSKQFQWFYMTDEERKRRLDFFSCIIWENLTYFEQKEILTDLKKFIHKNDLQKYANSKQSFQSIQESKESKMTHLFHVTRRNSNSNYKAKNIKFIDYQVPEIKKNSGKTKKQKKVRNVQLELELPEWSPVEDFLDSMDFGLPFQHGGTGLLVSTDEYDDILKELSLYDLLEEC